LTFQQDLSQQDTRSHPTRPAHSTTPAVGISKVAILFTLRERDKIQIKLFEVQYKCII